MAIFQRTAVLNVTIDQEWIDVTSEYPSPDERWRLTDDQGHEHHYDHGYPTLDFIIDRSHWCDGTEGLAFHDPHEAVDESHYECKLCRQVVEPRMHPGGWRRSIPGQQSATGGGTRSDGLSIEFYLTPDEVQRVRSGLDSEAQQALIDSVPDERVMSWRRTSR